MDDFFAGREESAHIFETLRIAVGDLGPAELYITKSQIGFRRHRPFAWAWIPGMYLRGEHAPLVLTLSLRRKDLSPRWKEIVEPAPGRFTHHLELRSESEIEGEIRRWLLEAWEATA